MIEELDGKLQYEHGSKEITTIGFLFKTPQEIYLPTQKIKNKRDEKEGFAMALLPLPHLIKVFNLEQRERESRVFGFNY